MYLISVSNKDELKFDFLSTVHNKLLERYEREINSFQPISLKGQEGLYAYLGRVFHLNKQQTKMILNQLAERKLCEIRKGPGIANYFIVIKEGGRK